MDQGSEKSLRLQAMLQEQLKPLFEKLDGLEMELKEIKESQEEIKKLFQNK